MKDWTPKGTLAQKLNVFISCCDGLLLLLESSRRVSEEESRSVLLEKYVRKRGRQNVTPSFILPGEVFREEWHESFSLDEIYKLKLQRQNDSCIKWLLEMQHSDGFCVVFFGFPLWCCLLVCEDVYLWMNFYYFFQTFLVFFYIF